MIVADTGAIIALIDADDHYHASMVALYDTDPTAWVLPWAILPEVDYLLAKRVGERAALLFRADLSTGAFTVAWGAQGDLVRAHALCIRYAGLTLGLVDGVVAAVAERLRAHAIATLDLRDFGPLELRGSPKLYPRDLG